jgi:alpha-L-arabinofuranosidase
MLSRNRQPILVKSQVENNGSALDVAATRSEDNKILVLQVVNFNDQPVTATLNLEGFVPRRPVAKAETLSGALDARNTAANPQFVKPVLTQWRDEFREGQTTYTFPADSLTVISFN